MAFFLLHQESRFKNYYHQLTWIIKLYREICEEVPDPLRKLMSPLTESISYHLHPGLSTLTWSSLNIDAYLHQVRLYIFLGTQTLPLNQGTTRVHCSSFINLVLI